MMSGFNLFGSTSSGKQIQTPVVPKKKAESGVVRNFMEIFEADRDLGGRIGDPFTHHRYLAFKEGRFSDFQFTLNGKSYPVHKCILSAESSYFQELFNSRWKDVAEGTIGSAADTTPEKAVEVFFQFLYTGLITGNDLKQFLFELYALSVRFKVKKLKRFCSESLSKYLSVESATAFLPWIRVHNDLKLQESLADSIGGYHRTLVEKNFPFHKAGKTILAQVFKKISQIITNRVAYNGYRYITCNAPKSLGTLIGDPCLHPQFDLLQRKNNTFSDFSIKYNEKVYPLHKYVLFSESLYFQTLLGSNWKEVNSNSYEFNLPGKMISPKSFEIFLSFLYTNLIPEMELEKYLFELYDLADYFQVKLLRELVSQGFKKMLEDSTVEGYLTMVRERDLVEFKGILVHFIAARFRELSNRDFPFHKLGKHMLRRVLQRIVVIASSDCNSMVRFYPSEFIVEETVEESDEEVEEF
jgi:hypothetical protein